MQVRKMPLSDKYMAGFLDADGSIGVRSRVGARPDLIVEVAQRVMYREVPEAYVTTFGGYLRERLDGQYVYAAMRGGMARKCVERLKGYLVCKHDFAAGALKLVDEAPVLQTQQDVADVRAQVRALRAVKGQTTANYPPRKWLAGYFDGDGCFSVKVCPKTGYAYPIAAILAAPAYRAGIDLIAKAFGGAIHQAGDNWTWQLQLSQPSKAKEFLEHFAHHLVIKRAQAAFLLGCAVGGNFRDGNAIREHVKALNSQQHRLSDPAGHAASLMQQVRFDIPKRRLGRPPGVIELRPRAPKRSRSEATVGLGE